MIAFLVLQTLVGLGPFTAHWNPYSDPIYKISDITIRLYVDDAIVANVPASVIASEQEFTVKTFGTHSVALTAVHTQLAVESGRTPAITFVNTAAQNDPACLAPLGVHAPAVFPTTVTLTTGKTGSPAFQNFLVTAPDPVIEIALQIDGKDQLPTGTGTDLRAFSALRFTMPLPGTHTMGVRVVTAFGCTLTKTAAPLIVKP